MDDDVAAAFAAASEHFVSLVAAVPGDGWPGAGLGEWSVLDLVAHTHRAHTTIEEYLLRPQPPQPLDGPYFAPSAIAERGRDAMRALGEDPVATVAEDAARVRDLVTTTDPGAVLGSPAGTQTVAAYLPSRVAELVIHGTDLAVAIDVAPTPPASALAVALDFVAARAAARSGVEVLRALTGRGDLPAGYSVY